MHTNKAEPKALFVPLLQNKKQPILYQYITPNDYQHARTSSIILKGARRIQAG
jgi:hypothetical protein